MLFLLRRVLAIFLIVGLGVSPLYASAMKGMEQSAQASSMAGMADDMPCHPANLRKSSSDKACPFMVACLSLCFQGMPPVAGAIVVPTTVKLRTAFRVSTRAREPGALTSRTTSPSLIFLVGA